jgi:hypothetical protein
LRAFTLKKLRPPRTKSDSVADPSLREYCCIHRSSDTHTSPIRCNYSQEASQSPDLTWERKMKRPESIRSSTNTTTMLPHQRLEKCSKWRCHGKPRYTGSPLAIGTMYHIVYIVIYHQCLHSSELVPPV